jgi:hypothetical protein
LFDTLSGAGMFGGFAQSGGGRIARSGKLALQRGDLRLKGCCRVNGLGWRHEGSRFEVWPLAIGAVKPDAELAGEAKRRESLGTRATRFMDGGIAIFSDSVKENGSLSWDDPLAAKAAQGVLKRLPLADVKGVMCSD